MGDKGPSRRYRELLSAMYDIAESSVEDVEQLKRLKAITDLLQKGWYVLPAHRSKEIP